MGWADGLLHEIDSASSEDALFATVQRAAEALGFEYCAYGMRVPVPITSPTIIMLNSYPRSWQERYAEQKYLEIDSTVELGRLSQ